MTGKLCDILDLLDEAELLEKKTNKWNKLLDTSKDEELLDSYITLLDNSLKDIESDIDGYKDKLRKRRNHARWRKKQRENQKTLKKVWEKCKAEDKEHIEHEYEKLIKEQPPPAVSISKKLRKKIEILIKIVKTTDNVKALYYKEKLDNLLRTPSAPTEISESPDPLVCEEHLEDYVNLLSDQSYYEKRKKDWEDYSISNLNI